MNKFKLVIFDWDGTVMDSVPKIVNCLRNTARELGIDIPSEQQAKYVIGLSLAKAAEVLFPAHAHLNDELVAGYKAQYRELDVTPTPLFADVETVLKQLSEAGMQLAVATGKGREGIDRLLNESGLGQYFVNVKCSDDAKSKPSPDMLEQILHEQGIAKRDAVMIGDSQLDMAMANAAGIACIGVSFGAHSPAQLQKHTPLCVVDSYQQLLQVLTTPLAASTHQHQTQPVV
ncbi:HAD family hydrolase [uncultured Pseudoalteromonas sp.]|uniref:HAD family hydrolase n=1 Tax=uncultured Pseudoalteromonas sp. TaxID=114053 RepID=UPI000C40ABDC|nr:HAD-IA family hydrolase [uncultured Pseudoalteromonas sp.]MBD56867.1 HAD family hydrolase [Pseudoalteromonas sp.]|tara:strand:- start:3118 stop:3810 length:693 start_codon:yes stop_codon:yes gene_type:complete